MWSYELEMAFFPNYHGGLDEKNPELGDKFFKLGLLGYYSRSTRTPFLLIKASPMKVRMPLISKTSSPSR